MKVKLIVVNGILASLYIAVSMLVQPLAFGNMQFRIPEIFNHLIIFSKSYFPGIVVGVFITNLFSPWGILDLIFGVSHSVLSLLISLFIIKHIRNIWVKMTINSVVFAVMMFLIAIEIQIASGLPFLIGWSTTFVGEFAIMMIGAPLMIALNKRLKFEKLI